MHLLEQACSRAPKSMYRTAVNMLVRQHACTCKMGYNVCLSYHMNIRQTSYPITVYERCAIQ